MNTDEAKVIHERQRLDRITERVIGCCHSVSNTLGAGGIVAGEFIADLLVERCVLLELKATRDMEDIFFAQCMNYLRATGLRVCLLVNFGRPRVVVRRIVNDY